MHALIEIVIDAGEAPSRLDDVHRGRSPERGRARGTAHDVVASPPVDVQAMFGRVDFLLGYDASNQRLVRRAGRGHGALRANPRQRTEQAGCHAGPAGISLAEWPVARGPPRTAGSPGPDPHSYWAPALARHDATRRGTLGTCGSPGLGRVWRRSPPDLFQRHDTEETLFTLTSQGADPAACFGGPAAEVFSGPCPQVARRAAVGARRLP